MSWSSMDAFTQGAASRSSRSPRRSGFRVGLQRNRDLGMWRKAGVRIAVASQIFLRNEDSARKRVLVGIRENEIECGIGQIVSCVRCAASL